MSAILSLFPLQSPHRGLPKSHHKSGAALVIVLAMLVMMLVLIMAFFSHATLQRQISASSAAGIQADFLSESATDIILSDILHEIQAGSEPDPLASTAESLVYQPLVDTNTFTVPSMQLQKAGGSTAANILKISRATTPFFTTEAGYRNIPDLGAEGADRASPVSTESPALGGRRFTKDRWFLPQLLQNTETNSFTSPDWIYLDREAKNPTTFDANSLKDYADKKLSNPHHVIGRFAYVIYDEGGLLDINLAGNALGANENARRGRLHQIPLTHIGSLSLPQINDFFDWRDAGEPVDPTSDGGLFDPKRTFFQVPSGSQAFVNRQDLIRYAHQSNSPLPIQALPFLTTFSCDRNAPHYKPDIPESTPSELEAEAFNPSLLAIRFPNETTLHRPEGDVTVPSGTPVVVRRFPLNKIDLLAEDHPDPAALKYYFGLEKVSGGYGYHYTAHIDGRIAKLSEVAQLGREPNFFELLQATILTGSLGRNVGNTYTIDNDRDEARNLQIIQIGANIIDQWDADDFPTTIGYPSGNSGEWEEFYGIENLPYINNIQLTGHRPAFDRDRFQAWAWFDVWNPHQNAKIPPKDIEAFRIIPTKGKVAVTFFYFVWMLDKQPNAGNFTFDGGNIFGGYAGPEQNIKELNADAFSESGGPGVSRFSWFDGKGDYSEPTILGSVQPPSSIEDRPTMLLVDYENVPPAVSEAKIVNGAHVRTDPNGKDVQPYINQLVALYRDPPTNGQPDSHWDVRLDTNGNVVGYDAKFGVKAQNQFLFRYVPGNEVTIELQAFIKGDWRTYQVFDGFLPKDNGLGGSFYAAGSAGLLDSREEVEKNNVAMFQTHTHHDKLAENPDILLSRFYEWEGASYELASNTSYSLFKIDPRTIRFGHSNSMRPRTLGRSIRISSAPYPATTIEKKTVQNDWSFIYGDRLPQDLTVFPRKPRTTDGGVVKDIYYWPFGLIANIPDGNLDTGSTDPSKNPMRYLDRDGVIRPGDGYVGSGNNQGAFPTVPGRIDDRPLILNRPFRSVGEMGYVFRDLPWKTLDFFSTQSGDLGLLDVFTIDETPGAIPLIAGKVNLNTPHPEILSLLLEGTTKDAYKFLENLPAPKTITSAEADALASEIVQESAKAPFRDRGDLVRRLLAPSTSSDAGVWSPVLKTERESAIRSLSEMGTVRTWNLMIDLVVQSGQFTPSSQIGADFFVRAERRIWVHLAIDRFTGEILNRQVEVVNE